jgi:hypothetical protein
MLEIHESDHDNTRLSNQQETLLNMVADATRRLNASIREAVAAGISIEVQRTARHHCGGGYWGDVVAPKVVKQ